MKKIYFSAVVLGLAMAACSSQDDIFVEEQKGIETISAEIIQLAGMGSRVIIGDAVDGVHPMSWRADDPRTTKKDEADVIVVYDSNKNLATFKYTETTDAAKGQFVKKEGAVITDIAGALAAPSLVSLPTPTTGKSPSVKFDEEGNLFFSYVNTMMYHRGSENAPMYGTMGTDGVLKFQPLTGVLRIRIPNLKTDFYDKIKYDNRKSLAIKVIAYGTDGKYKNIASTVAKINPKDNPIKVELTGSHKEFISLFLEAGIFEGMEESPVVSCPILPGDYQKFEIEIRYWNIGGDVMSKPVTVQGLNGEALSIGKEIYTINPKFEYNTDFVEPEQKPKN